MRRRLLLPLFALSLMVLATASRAGAQVSFINIADSSMTVPGGGGTFGSVAWPTINARGEVAFSGGVHLYIGDGTAITRILEGGEPAPGGGTFTPFNARRPVINDNGFVAFHSTLNLGTPDGYFVTNGTNKTLIAKLDMPAPGGGTYSWFVGGSYPPSINTSGMVAYNAYTTLSSHANLFVHDGVQGVRVAASGDAAPGGGTFFEFDDLHMNEAGTVAFHAQLTGGPGWGLYRFNGGGVGERIIAAGEDAPGGGTFLRPILPTLNDNGWMSFRSTTTGGPAQAIYLTDGANTWRLAAVGETAPGGEVFQGFATYTSLNNNGLVAFASRNGLTNSSVVQNIYVASPVSTQRIVGLGDALFGSSITSLGFFNRERLNDAGQLAFFYELQNGRTGIAVATLAAAAAPEPATCALLATGLLPVAAGAARRRRSGNRREK